MSGTLQEQIAPETAQAIAALASASGQTINDYLRNLLGLNGQGNADSHEPEKKQRDGELEPTPYELIADLIGSIDSSVPDPESPPRHTAFGQYLLEKHRKQAERFK